MIRKMVLMAAVAAMGSASMGMDAQKKDVIYTNSFEICKPADSPTNIWFWRGGNLHNWTRDTVRVVEDPSHDGKKALQLDLRGGVIAQALITPARDGGEAMALSVGKPYSFSLYAKAERDGAKLTLGHDWGKSHQTFDVGKDWQRLVFRFTPTSTNGPLRVSPEPDCRFWIDAVQFEEGDATPFDPNAVTLDPRCWLGDPQKHSDQVGIKVPLVAKAPVLDGKFDDACWTDAPVFSIASPKDGPKGATEFKLVSDGQFFYLAATCHEPDMKKVKAECTGRNSLVYTDDSLEIFLKSRLDRPPYDHFMLNSKGVMAQERCKGTGWGNGPWWDAKTQQSDDSWSAEIQLHVPFNYGAATAPDAPFLFNICRTRPVVNEYLPWHGFYHRPETYAALTGVLRPGPLLQETGFDYACGANRGELLAKFQVRNVSGKPLALAPSLLVKHDDKETIVPGAKLDLPVGGEGEFVFPVAATTKATVELRQQDGKAFAVEHANSRIIDSADLIRGPLLRHNVYSPEDKVADFKLDLSRLGASLSGSLIEMTVKDLYGKTAWTGNLTATASLRGEIPLAGLSPGDWDLHIAATRDGKTLTTTRCFFRLVPPGGATKLCRTDRFRRVVVCGSRPLTGLCGAYIFSGNSDEMAQARMDDLRTRGAKFLYILDEFAKRNGSPERMRRLLDMAESRGYMCIVGLEFPREAELTQDEILNRRGYVAQLRDHPALLGYDLADEVVPVQQAYMSAVSPLFQALDPAHPMSMNLNHIEKKIKDWSRYQNDFTLIDNYDSPPLVYFAIRNMRRAVPWTALYYWTRSYHEGVGRSSPSPEEFLAGAYAGIVNGASIVAPFVYRPASTVLWESWKRLADEMETIKAALATEDFVDFGDDDGNVGASLRRTEAGVYVLALALSDKPETVHLPLPGLQGKDTTAQVLFENRDVAVKDGVIVDVFEPNARHVYRLEEL